jgi:anti-anti-sigma factor
MEMRIEELGNGVNQVGLVGAFDINGAADVDLRFAALAGSRDKILVDLTEVASLASIGIRTLLVNAKVVTRRGGKFVLAGPRPMVKEALQTAGITVIIPTYSDVDTAMQAFSA